MPRDPGPRVFNCRLVAAGSAALSKFVATCYRLFPSFRPLPLRTLREARSAFLVCLQSYQSFVFRQETHASISRDITATISLLPSQCVLFVRVNWWNSCLLPCRLVIVRLSIGARVSLRDAADWKVRAPATACNKIPSFSLLPSVKFRRPVFHRHHTYAQMLDLPLVRGPVETGLGDPPSGTLLGAVPPRRGRWALCQKPAVLSGPG